jgi:glutamine synthetase type III
VVFTLRALGIPVEYTHHEVGPSQHAIDMHFADGLAMADYTMTYRIAVTEVAHEHGYYATFMPKPLYGENGSGCTRTSGCSAATRTRSSIQRASSTYPTSPRRSSPVSCGTPASCQRSSPRR